MVGVIDGVKLMVGVTEGVTDGLGLGVGLGGITQSLQS
jgi:hypothetical protein